MLPYVTLLDLTLKVLIKIIFSYFAEYKSKLFLNRKWFEMWFLLGLYLQLKSHFFFGKFSSIKSVSMGLSSKDKNLTVMSSRTNTMIPPPFWSRSKRNGEEYPGILNWLSGKESSSFVSEMTITSTFPEIWSVRISNLFLKEFMLRWDKTIRLGFFVRITFRLLSETTLDKRSDISSLDSHSWTLLENNLNQYYLKK